MMATVDTKNAAKLLGWHFNTVLKWARLGKIKTAQRASSAPQAPWKYDREEIVGLKNANHQG